MQADSSDALVGAIVSPDQGGVTIGLKRASDVPVDAVEEEAKGFTCPTSGLGWFRLLAQRDGLRLSEAQVGVLEAQGITDYAEDGWVPSDTACATLWEAMLPEHKQPYDNLGAGINPNISLSKRSRKSRNSNRSAPVHRFTKKQIGRFSMQCEADFMGLFANFLNSDDIHYVSWIGSLRANHVRQGNAMVEVWRRAGARKEPLALCSSTASMDCDAPIETLPDGTDVPLLPESLTWVLPIRPRLARCIHRACALPAATLENAGNAVAAEAACSTAWSEFSDTQRTFFTTLSQQEHRAYQREVGAWLSAHPEVPSMAFARATVAKARAHVGAQRRDEMHADAASFMDEIQYSLSSTPKSERDPNEPRKPLTAYNIFAKEHWTKAGESKEGAMRTLGTWWKALDADQKKEWEMKSAEDRVRYKAEKAQYDAQVKAQQQTAQQETQKLGGTSSPAYVTRCEEGKVVHAVPCNTSSPAWACVGSMSGPSDMLVAHAMREWARMDWGGRVLTAKLVGGWGNRVRGVLTTAWVAFVTGRGFAIEHRAGTGLATYMGPNKVDWLRTAPSEESFACVDAYGTRARECAIQLMTKTKASLNVAVNWFLFSDFKSLAFRLYPERMHPFTQVSTPEAFLTPLYEALFKPSVAVMKHVEGTFEGLRAAGATFIVVLHARVSGKATKDSHIRMPVADASKFGACVESMAKLWGQPLAGVGSIVLSDSADALSRMKASLVDIGVSPEHIATTEALGAVDHIDKGAGADAQLRNYVDFELIRRAEHAVIFEKSTFPTMALVTGGRKKTVWQLKNCVSASPLAFERM